MYVRVRTCVVVVLGRIISCSCRINRSEILLRHALSQLSPFIDDYLLTMKKLNNENEALPLLGTVDQVFGQRHNHLLLNVLWPDSSLTKRSGELIVKRRSYMAVAPLPTAKFLA